MHKYFIIVFIIISFFLLVYIWKDKFVTTTMQYFPIDDQVTFDDALTNITATKKKDELTWRVESTSSEEVYLRQDVSLLYENGKFKGVFSKWRQDVAHLESTKSFPLNNSSLLQAISFHHGEIHYPNDKINSIQRMTDAQLYYIHDHNTTFSFQKPQTPDEKEWAKKLNKMTKQQLLYYWNNLISYLQINQEEYLLIPLTEMIQFEHNPLPGRSQAETKQIIGQLWEGLYRNYIVLVANNAMGETTHYIPLILIAKDNSHLLVIYELDNQPEKLIQKLPALQN